VQKSIYRKGVLDFLRAAVLPVLFTFSVILFIVMALHRTEIASRDEGLRILEDSLRRAVVMNYAIDGRYPESVEYIEEKFGIHIDRTRFVVHYSIFAPNIFPEIRIIQL